MSVSTELFFYKYPVFPVIKNYPEIFSCERSPPSLHQRIPGVTIHIRGAQQGIYEPAREPSGYGTKNSDRLRVLVQRLRPLQKRVPGVWGDNRKTVLDRVCRCGLLPGVRLLRQRPEAPALREVPGSRVRAVHPVQGPGHDGRGGGGLPCGNGTGTPGPEVTRGCLEKEPCPPVKSR